MLSRVRNGYARIRKATPLLLFFLVIKVIAFAQVKGDGKAGIEAATKLVTGYYSTAINLLYGIGAIVGIVGAVKVFNKWNSGDQDTSKSAASWFGSCIFLVVVAAVLSGFFGVK